MKYWVLGFLFLPLLAVSQEQLKLTGNIEGLPDDTKVSIVDANNPSDTIGQSTIKNGKFSLNAQLKEPTLVNIWFGYGKNIMTFLENSTVTINGSLTDLQNLQK